MTERDKSIEEAANKYGKDYVNGENYHGFLAGAQYAFAQFDAEIVKLRDQRDKAVAALKEIEIHFAHPNHDHNWAFYVNTVVAKTLREIGE